MEKLKLVRPTKELESAILEYKQEFLECGESRINGSCGITHFENFDVWLEMATSIVSDTLSRDGVYASTFFTVRESDQKIVGSIQLRHSLTEKLRKYGGHIGYAIRPSERRKGYGKEQLRLVLNVAREMKIPEVMIACDRENIASAKTIMACGGILTEEKKVRGEMVQTYWISLETT